MIIKLTEFDGEVVAINSNAITIIRPCDDVPESKSIVFFVNNNNTHESYIMVKESINEIIAKTSMNPLF